MTGIAMAKRAVVAGASSGMILVFSADAIVSDQLTSLQESS